MGKLLEELIVRYKTDTAELKTGLKQVKEELSSVSSAASKSGDGMLSGFKKAGGGLLDFGAKVGQTIFGLQGLAQGAMSFGEALIGPNASMEQTTVAFETLLGKGKKTQSFLNDLKQFAANTPFEFPELATDAEHMIAFGFSAKEVIPDLTDIGDAMSALGKSNAEIDSVVNTLGQMKTAGKINAQDMMQLTSQGIPAWKILADAMHLTVGQVQDLSQKGLLPADKSVQLLLAGMEKTFGPGMQAQSQTFNGLLSTFQDNATAALRAFTGPLFDEAKQALTTLGNLVSSQKFQDFATGAGKKVGEIIGFISDKVSSALPSLQDIGNTFQQVGSFMESTFLPPAREIFNVAGQIVTNFIEWNNKTHFLQNTLQDVGNFIGGVATTVATKLMPPVRDAIAAFQNWLSKSNFVHDALSILGDVIDKVSGVAGTLVGWVAKLFDWFGQSKGRADALKDAIFAIGLAFAGVKILKFGKDVFTTMSGAVTDVKKVVSAVGDIKDKASDAWGFLRDTFGPKVKGLFSGKDGVESAVNKVTDAESGIASQAVKTEATVATETGLMDAELEGVGAAANTAKKDITGIGPAAASAKVSAVGSFSALAAGILSAGIAAIVGLEAYMLKDALPALAESWLNNNYRPPSGPGSYHPQRYDTGVSEGGSGAGRAHHALGTSSAPGGPSIVAEDGAELVMGPRAGYLPRGSRVFNHSDTMDMMSGSNSSSQPIIITVEMDSMVMAQANARTTDRHVRLKLGAGGRAA